MTLVLNGTDNSTTAPAVQGGTGGTTTGLYYPANNQVSIATNGTQALLVDSNQNIGIGTASPTNKLDIVGGSDILRLTNTSASGYEAINMVVGTQAARIVLTGQSFGDANYGTGDITIQAQTAGKGIRFATNGTTGQMILDSSGNLGIGTTSPVSQLTLAKTSDLVFTQNGYGITWSSDNGSPKIYGTSGGALNFKHGGGSLGMLMNSSGQVGIGITSPAALLHVGALNGTGSLNGYTKLVVEGTDYAVITLKSPAANFNQIIFTDTTTTSLGGINYFNSTNATPNAMAFLTAGSERMRITSAGNIGIGTTSPAYKLDVNGDINVPSDSSYFLGANGDRYLKYRSGNNDVLLSSYSGLFYQQSVGSLYHAWFTGNNERARINAYGLGLGGTAASSGTGIAFPASQSASTDPNTLDDYEEGTFTPNCVNNGSSSTFTVKNGYYRKIGSLVICWVDFDGGNSGTAGTTLQVTGLPFTVVTGPRGVMNGGFWGANSLATNNGGFDPQGTTTNVNVYIGGGVVTSQTTYLSGTIIYMASA